MKNNEIRFGHHNDIVASLHSPSPCSTGQRPWQTYALEAEGNGDTPKYETEQVDHHFMHHLIITRTLNTNIAKYRFVHVSIWHIDQFQLLSAGWSFCSRNVQTHVSHTFYNVFPEFGDEDVRMSTSMSKYFEIKQSWCDQSWVPMASYEEWDL